MASPGASGLLASLVRDMRVEGQEPLSLCVFWGVGERPDEALKGWVGRQVVRLFASGLHMGIGRGWEAV